MPVNPALETLMLVFSPDVDGVPRDRCLFLGAEPHPALSEWSDIVGWQPLKPKADAWERAGFERIDHLGDRKFPLAIFLPGKSRDETLAGFAMARDALLPGGRIAAALPNTGGAARFEKEFAKATGEVESIQKHKCRAFHAVHGDLWNETLFDEWRTLAIPRAIDESPFVTTAGIFSEGRIDPGSKLLADHLPASIRGKVADLGAGWGYLSDCVLRRCPDIERVDLFEADARALACARSNLADHSSRDLGFHWHDVTTGVPGGFDAVVMNPPFHSGQAEDVGLGRAFLATAAAALRRGGRLFLVANRQLPYESVLTELGFAHRSPAGNETYKLIFADKR